jgi:hypothetical protein
VAGVPPGVTGPRPALSVVVAHPEPSRGVDATLAPLVAQAAPAGVEVLLVAGGDGVAELVRTRFPAVAVVPGRPSALVPELWATGIRASRGEVVALTTTHCVPGDEWLARIGEAHRAAVAAVGGAIECEGTAGIVGWAVYFCRYSAYMPPLREGPVAELAADNASYKRADLDRCAESWRQGFWEPAVHAALRHARRPLWLAPSVLVRHWPAFRIGGFARQRFRHGRQFGGARVARHGPGRRALYVVLSPAVPGLLLARIARNVLVRRRHRVRLLLALPLVALFVGAWSCGELMGYLRGPAG